MDEFVSAFVEFPKPLVALCNGPAIGIAATTVGLCDLAWASDSAYFLCPFTKIAQSAEGCSSATFPKIMGNAVANEMLVANTKLTAEEVKINTNFDFNSPSIIFIAFKVPLFHDVEPHRIYRSPVGISSLA